MSGQMYTKYGKTCRNKKSSESSPELDKEDKTEKHGEDDGAIKHEDENKRKDTAGASGIGAVADDDEAEVRKSSASGVVSRKNNAGVHSDVNEKEEEEEEDSALYRKSSSLGKDTDAKEQLNAGSESDDEGDAESTVQSSNEKFTGDDDEGGESGGAGGDDEQGDDATEEDADESAEYDEDQDGSEETAEYDETIGEEASADEKKRRKGKGVLEYEIGYMYPEINVLIQKKKREWDFQDPDIIRAVWLETKTQALSEWKVRNAKIKIDKPSFEVRDTVTVTMRQEHLKNKAELQRAWEERDFEMTEASRDPPHFSSIQLATNLTTDMRYKYNRNNPPVPSHYIEHFEKFKKPPFKNHPI